MVLQMDSLKVASMGESLELGSVEQMVAQMAARKASQTVAE